MPERDPLPWQPHEERPASPASIADELASRLDALSGSPDDAVHWASVAAGLEREAAAIGALPAAAPLLHQAARIHEEQLGDAEGALSLQRRAVAADRGFLPALRACRRLALDRGDDALAADALEAEADLATDGTSRAELLLFRGRLLAALGRPGEAEEALARGAAAAPGAFATAAEAARAAAAGEDRAALADAWVRCASAAGDRRLAAHYLASAAALRDEALGEPERGGDLALEALAACPEDPRVRAAARRHAERLGRTDALARILRAEAEDAAGAAAAEAWLALAEVEERRGRAEDAVAALERARAAAPRDPQILAELVRLREASGAWADACEALEALAGAHLALEEPGHVEEAVLAKLRRAEIEEARLGRTLLALEALRDVLELDPANRTALSGTGRLCAALGEWDGLVDAFEAEARAARDPRERAQRTFKAGEVLEEKLGRVDDALAAYRSALALDPDLVAARAALERLLEGEARWADLCALLEGDLDGMRSVADRVTHLFRIARIRDERLRDPEGAAGAYRRLLALDPGNRLAFPALGAVLRRLGRVEELAALLREEASAAEEPGRRVALLQRRAELLEDERDDPELARAAWEDVRAAAPRHLPALRAIGRLHARAGRWEDLAALHRAEADASGDPATAAELLQRAGELLDRRLGRVEEALAAHRDALVLSPGHLPSLAALARLHEARGDDEGLVDALRAQAAARPGRAARAALLARAGRIAEERLGDRARAIEHHEEALRVVPGFRPSLRALDRLYADTGRAEALAALRRAAAADPDAPDRPERLLGLARLEVDRLRDVPAALRAAAPLLADAADPAALLLELRLAAEPPRRARALAALADGASDPGARAALLTAAALELPAGAARQATLARAAALAPGTALLAPEEERRLREGGDPGALARFCEARRDAEGDRAARAAWSVEAGEAWARAGDDDRALAAFQGALEAGSSLAALRGARAAFARRGEWAAVRGAWQAEGAALRDGSDAAAAWLAAGEIAERRFADPEAAISDYRRAAERDPASPEPLRRLEALAGGAGAVAGVHEARARAERDPRRAAESWLAAARGAALAGSREGALAALDRALEASPALAPALELRARLRAEAGDPAPALADLEACLALGGEPAPRLALHLSAARLAEGLGDAPRALAHLNDALALAPESPAALAHLARVQATLGRPAQAAAALRRLVDVPGLERDALVGHLVALAEADERHGSAEGAVAACRRALDLDPGRDDVLRRLLRLEAGAGPAARLPTLEAAAERARDPALRVEARLQAARLLAGEPGSRERAAEHLRAALALDPARAEARAALAELLEGWSPAEAADQHRLLLAADPLRPASWSALYRHAERSRSYDRAYVAASVLAWLGAAPASAGSLLAEGARQVLPAPPPLSDADLALLRAPGDGGPIGAVLEAAGDAFAAIARVPRAGRREALRDHALRGLVDELTRALGAPPCELHPGALGRVEAEPGAPWVVRVGPDVARRTTARERRFLVGRAAVRLRTRSCLAEALPAATLAGLVAAAIGAVVPGWRGGAVDEALARRIARGVGRRGRRALEEAARFAAEGPLPDLEAWRASAAATANRAGLVLCGDVPAALSLLLRDGPGRSPEPGAAAAHAAAARPDALALLSFAASEAHFGLRQRLRVAIA